MMTVIPKRDAVMPVLQEVASHYDMPVSALTDKVNNRLILQAVRVSIFLIRHIYPLLDNWQIALLFGRDDRSWVTYHVKVLSNEVAVYPDLCRDIETLRARIVARMNDAGATTDVAAPDA